MFLLLHWNYGSNQSIPSWDSSSLTLSFSSNFCNNKLTKSGTHMRKRSPPIVGPTLKNSLSVHGCTNCYWIFLSSIHRSECRAGLPFSHGDTHDTVIANHKYTQTIWCIFCSPSRRGGIRTRDRPLRTIFWVFHALDHSATIPDSRFLLLLLQCIICLLQNMTRL